METIVSCPPLNETQIFLLQAFAQIKTEEEKADIQSLLLNYYQEKVDAYASNNSLSKEKIDEILNAHYRTPYK